MNSYILVFMLGWLTGIVAMWYIIPIFDDMKRYKKWKEWQKRKRDKQ